jgi:hemoglobin
VKVDAQDDRTGTSLYDRLGGRAAIRKVVDDLVALAADDPKVNFTRKGHPNEWEATEENVERLKERVVQFVAVTAGARDVKYEGKDMVTAHKGMGITNGEFDAFATHLKAALEKNNVPLREQEELLDAVESTRGAIVEEGRTE